MKWLKVNRQTIAFDDLPAHLHGLRILHISDLHSNHPRRMNLNIWPTIAKLDFDMAVITGDLILGRKLPADADIAEFEPHRVGLEGLAARVPTYFVEGNHERHLFPRMRRLMAEVGITFLHNETATLTVGMGELEVVGTKDFKTLRREGFDEFDGLIARDGGNFRLFLVHQPQLFDKIKHSRGLTLAGHTHGGQLRLPFMPTIFAPNQGFFPAYGDGLYRHGNAQMYVSKGIGTTYFPIRFFNRPEIGLYELRNTNP